LAEAVKLMFATAAAVASATASAKEEATAEQHNVEDAAPEKQEVDEVTAAVEAREDITPGSQEDQKELEEDKDAEALDHDQAAVTAAAAPADKLVVATAAPPVVGSAVTQDIGAAAPTTIAAIATAPQAARAIQEPAPATAAAALLAGENRWLPWSTAKARAAKDKESAECLSGQLQFSITMPGNTLQAADGSASAKTTKTRKTQGGGKRKDKTAPPPNVEQPATSTSGIHFRATPPVAVAVAPGYTPLRNPVAGAGAPFEGLFDATPSRTPSPWHVAQPAHPAAHPQPAYPIHQQPAYPIHPQPTYSAHPQPAALPPRVLPTPPAQTGYHVRALPAGAVIAGSSQGYDFTFENGFNSVSAPPALQDPAPETDDRTQAEWWMPRLPFNVGWPASAPTAYPTMYPQAGSSHTLVHPGLGLRFKPYPARAPTHEVVMTGKRGRAPDDALEPAGANWRRRYN
jgi:hypothetical protein